MSRSPSPLKSAYRLNTYEGHVHYENGYDRHDETYFESFEEEDKEQYFYNPKEHGPLVLDLLDGTSPTNKDRQFSPTVRALKNQKSLGSLANFDIETLNQYVQVIYLKRSLIVIEIVEHQSRLHWHQDP